MEKGKVLISTLLLSFITISMLCTNVKYTSASLIRFKSNQELKEFLKSAQPNIDFYDRSWGFSLNGLKAMTETNDFSRTNIQVEGVDEADIVKTDGEYIYLIADQKVFIVKAYPAEEAAVLSRIIVNGTLDQIFINQERLVVFYKGAGDNEAKTVIDIYDIADKTNPLLKREITVEGQYFSSRMIGNYVYIVTLKNAWLVNEEVDLPKIYVGDDVNVVSATDIYYSSIVDYGYVYTIITAVNVQEDEQAPDHKIILTGWTTKMYVSLENIYLAMDCGDSTLLHRIHIENGEITCAASGEVSGSVLNQFSMDEHEGYFRIATTSQIRNRAAWFTLMNMQNNLYILNMDLQIAGKIEEIAPGERIHSVRFMGDLCYLVTFRKVDPLFVIALWDPYNPVVLGELEITGYSDYLHIYDENHVIGVGKETVAAEQGDFSWYQGIKISLFDVANKTNPKELAKYEIGDRGTESPVLTDHKAFLFDKEKSLLVIPVSVAKVDESKYPQGVPPYISGEVVWQGAYVFAVSLELEEKIALRGSITHIENGNVHDASHHVKRTLYIDEVLYTISDSKIKMNSLADLSEINELNLTE